MPRGGNRVSAKDAPSVSSQFRRGGTRAFPVRDRADVVIYEPTPSMGPFEKTQRVFFFYKNTPSLTRDNLFAK